MTSEMDIDDLIWEDYLKLYRPVEIYFEDLKDYTYENVISCKCNGDIILHCKFANTPHFYCTPEGKEIMIEKIEIAKLIHIFSKATI